MCIRIWFGRGTGRGRPILERIKDLRGDRWSSYAKRNSALRAVAARYLVRYAGLTQREVSKLLGMSTGGAVSARRAQLPELIRMDVRLGRRLGVIERLLDKKRAEGASGSIRKGKAKP